MKDEDTQQKRWRCVETEKLTQGRGGGKVREANER